MDLTILKLPLITGIVGVLTGVLITYFFSSESVSSRVTNSDTQYQALERKIDRLEVIMHQQNDTLAASLPVLQASGHSAPNYDAIQHSNRRTTSQMLAPDDKKIKEEQVQIDEMLANIQARSYDRSATFREVMASDEWTRLSLSVQKRVIEEVTRKANSGEIPISFIFPASQVKHQQ